MADFLICKIATDIHFIEIIAEPIKTELDGTFVHPTHNWDGNPAEEYTVSEPRTGFRVSHGATREEAIQNAKNTLSRIGMDEVERVIQETENSNDHYLREGAPVKRIVNGLVDWLSV